MAADPTVPAGARALLGRWWRTASTSVRGRATVLATLVVAVTLAVGAAGMLALYRNQLLAGLDASLEQQAADRARLLDQGSDPASLVTTQQDESMVWIGTAAGRALATGGSLVPVGDPRPPTVGQTASYELLMAEAEPGEDERELAEMRIASAATADGGRLVLVGAEEEVVDHPVAAVGRLIAVGLPPLVALVAGLTWFTTGLALRPVEAIRARAAEISGTSLGDRVPVPGSDDEIGQLAVTMNSMLDRIESHERSLRQFTADASHELKSPVANLRALVDTADLADPAWDALRARLVAESDRLRDLVDNLLFLASHEAGRPVEHPTAVAVDDLLFAEAELLAATGDLAVDLGGVQPATVQGSPAELGRLVRNLVDNAARHARTRVALGVEDDGTGVTVTVGDDGPGIDPAHHERIFERFTRLDEARARDAGGAGLGLAIVRHIADGHGAAVSVGRSALGGAELRVRFPG